MPSFFSTLSYKILTSTLSCQIYPGLQGHPELSFIIQHYRLYSVGSMKLTYQKELNLNLYRHWSISESLHHTIYTAAKFKIWTHKGKQKLSEFLAELGLPLVQVKQTFATMDLSIRTELRSMFEEKTEKYGLEDITYNSFVASFGFRHKFCAADIVFAVLALLEQLQESVSYHIMTSHLF